MVHVTRLYQRDISFKNRNAERKNTNDNQET